MTAARPQSRGENAPTTLPPLLPGVGLLFWGWRQDLLPLGIALGLLLEGVRASGYRLPLTRNDYHRIGDLATVIFLVVAGLLALSDNRQPLILGILRWLPLVFLPIAAAQLLGRQGRLPLSTLFYALRRNPREAAPPIDALPGFLGVCLLSAGAQPAETLWHYFLPTALLLGAALAGVAPRHPPRPLWGIALALGLALGWLGQTGIQAMEAAIQARVMAIFQELYRVGRDPFRGHTSIGEVGELKLTSRILFRVDLAHRRGPMPTLLAEAAYNIYHRGSWFLGEGTFAPLTPEGSGRWPLPGAAPAAAAPVNGHLTVHRRHSEPRGVVALPHGAQQIDGLPAEGLDRNALGTVRGEGLPGFASYRVAYGPTLAGQSPPTEYDRRIPRQEEALLARQAARLGLAALPEEQRVARLLSHFQAHFHYSLQLTRGDEEATPLGDFLENHHSGHCEYFAAAAALLLRQSGIPTRYVVGYALEELDPTRDTVVVRGRHAHAWLVAWIGGAWQVVDPTPPGWSTLEAERDPPWQWLADGLAALRFHWNRLRQGQGAGWNLWAAIALVVLAGILAWRIGRDLAPRLRGARRGRGEAPTPPGEASPFQAVVAELARRRLVRPPGRPWRGWLREQPKLAGDAALGALLHWHYRLLYDPRGLSVTERERFARAVRQWLAEYAARGDH